MPAARLASLALPVLLARVLRLLRRRWAPLLFWCTLGYLLHDLALRASAWLAHRHQWLGFGGLAIGVLVTLSTTIMMFHAARSALVNVDTRGEPSVLVVTRTRRIVDAIGETILPFLVVYSAWGLFAEEVRTWGIHVINQDLTAADTLDVFRDMTGAPLIVALAAWVLRAGLERVRDHEGAGDRVLTDHAAGVRVVEVQTPVTPALNVGVAFFRDPLHVLRPRVGVGLGQPGAELADQPGGLRGRSRRDRLGGRVGGRLAAGRLPAMADERLGLAHRADRRRRGGRVGPPLGLAGHRRRGVRRGHEPRGHGGHRASAARCRGPAPPSPPSGSSALGPPHPRGTRQVDAARQRLAHGGRRGPSALPHLLPRLRARRGGHGVGVHRPHPPHRSAPVGLVVASARGAVVRRGRGARGAADRGARGDVRPVPGTPAPTGGGAASSFQRTDSAPWWGSPPESTSEGNGPVQRTSTALAKASADPFQRSRSDGLGRPAPALLPRRRSRQWAGHTAA